MNAFFASDADVDLENILQACQNYSDHSPDEHGNTVCRRLASHNSSLFTSEMYFDIKLLICTGDDLVTAQLICLHLQTGNMSVYDSSGFKIIATPDTVVDYTQSVTLSVTGTESLPSKGLTFEWKCSKYNYEFTTENFKLVFKP